MTMKQFCGTKTAGRGPARAAGGPASLHDGNGAAAREREAFLAAISDAAPVGIALWDLTGNGRAAYANLFLARAIGCSREELCALRAGGIRELIHPEDCAEARRFLEKCRAARDGERVSCEFRVRRPGRAGRGSQEGFQWFRASGTPFTRDGGGAVTRLLFVIEEITELRLQRDASRERGERLETRVRQHTAELSKSAGRLRREVAQRENVERAMVGVAEREQRRIGDRLHETLSQQLTGAALALKAIGDALARRGVPEAGKLERIAHMVNDGIAQTREIVQSLRPVEFDPEGLMAALRELAARASAKVPCVFDCPKPVRVADSEVTLHLYRIAQEAVENALKHARAREIILSLRGNRSGLVLEIRDDGAGLPRDPRRAGAMGCRIMECRAGIIGATLRMEPARETGTRVCCELSFQK